MKYRIPIIKPTFPSATGVLSDYKTIQGNNWYTNFGPFEVKFRHELSHYIGHSVKVATVSNATLGLILAIKAVLGESQGQKAQVLMPAFTFAAAAEALIWCGYEPVFVDIEPQTLQLDISQANDYLKKNHKQVAGILFCNVFGIGAERIDGLEKLCARYKLPLIIDSAAGFGSSYKDGSKLGYRGDCEVFSFHATKSFAIGEGGAITSRSKEHIDSILQLQNFGFNDKKEALTNGLNAKLDEFSSAIGLRQLKAIDRRVQRRQKTLLQYKNLLTKYGYTFPDNDDNSAVCFVSTLAPSKEAANQFYSQLVNHGIEAKRYYNPPLHRHPAFTKKSRHLKLTITEDVCSRVISLPAHDDVTPETVKYICSLTAPGNK